MVRTVAFIPLRGGSKSIPLKNIKEIAGKPLAHWAIEEILTVDSIDQLVVSTDSEEIKKSLEKFSSHPKFKIFNRGQECASDTASTESALAEYFGKEDCERIVLVQATSPLLQAEDLKNALNKFESEGRDSLLSVVEQKRFFWQADGNNYKPVNYNFEQRPRRQDFSGQLVENGAFYIFTKKLFDQTGCRLGGSIGVYVMDEQSYFEIDEPSDWVIVEGLLHKQRKTKRTSKPIKLLITDVDGVLTDAGMYYSNSGEELKKFNTRDGMGIELLRKAGVPTAVITSENTRIVADRAAKLKIEHLYQGQKDKVAAVKEICRHYSIDPQEIAYIGDDLNDLTAMELVGLVACPADAASKVMRQADYVCEKNGGQGCVREFVDYILENFLNQ